jgi:hypothetical protein
VSRTLDVRWQDWSGKSLKHLVLREAPDGNSAESVVLGPPGVEVFAARYRILCDVG